MISSEEMITFIREIYLLINEYNRCDDLKIKNLINDDILFLSNIIKH